MKDGFIQAEIKVGDLVRHESLPSGLMDLEVLDVQRCALIGRTKSRCWQHQGHSMLLITDPETKDDSPEWVCGLEFIVSTGAVT
jgi:hypothetical protein